MLFFVLSLWKPGSVLYSERISIWPGHVSSAQGPHMAGGLCISTSPHSFLQTLQGPCELKNKDWKSKKKSWEMGETCSKKMSSILNISLVLHCCLFKSPWNSWLNRNLSSHANNTNLSSPISVGHKPWLAGLVPLHLISQNQDQGVLMLSFYGEVLEIICSQAHSGCWPSSGSCNFMTYVSIASVKCQPGLSHCI